MSSSIPDNQLGLSQSEVQLLRQHQQIALSQQGSSSSRAASHASSQGRLLLDPTSLQALSAHFDRLMYSIQQRWHYVWTFTRPPPSPSRTSYSYADKPHSSTSRHRRPPRSSTTVPAMPYRMQTPRSRASGPSSVKSTSCRSNSTRCGVSAR